jgi:two-component system OmpR family response regulator
MTESTTSPPRDFSSYELESGAVSQPRVLFLTDDVAESEVRSFALRRKHVQAVAVPMAEFGSVADVPDPCDLIVFELNHTTADLPSQLQEIVASFRGPVLLVTYENDERYQIKAYDAGIAECIKKPIGMNLLLAKIQAWLRQAEHTNRTQREKARGTGFKLNSGTRFVRTPEGNVVKLSYLEFRLLQLLLGSPGRILESNLLMELLWTEYDRDNGALLKSLIYRARQKIETDPGDPQYILTVPGQGYMFSLSDKSGAAIPDDG